MAAARYAWYKPEVVEEIRRRLRSLPEPTPAKITKLEIVRALVAEVEELQKLGHPLQAIAETISAVGVPITRATLKTYLGKLRSTSRRIKERRPRDFAGQTSTMRRPVGRVSDNDGAMPDGEKQRILRGTTTANVRRSEHDTEEKSCTQREKASAANGAVMLEQLVKTTGTAGEKTPNEVDNGRPTPLVVNRAQIVKERGEALLEPTGRSMADGKENSLEKRPVNHAVNGPVAVRQLGENTREIQDPEAVDINDNSSKDGSVIGPSTAGAGQATHRVSAKEIERRRWMFIPREDSREI